MWNGKNMGLEVEDLFLIPETDRVILGESSGFPEI